MVDADPAGDGRRVGRGCRSSGGGGCGGALLHTRWRAGLLIRRRHPSEAAAAGGGRVGRLPDQTMQRETEGVQK